MMGFFSYIAGSCSSAGQWVKNNPWKAGGLSLVSVLSGVAVGYIVATAVSSGAGVVCGMALGAFVEAKGIGVGIELDRREAEIDSLRINNNKLIEADAKRTLELVTVRKTNDLNTTVIQQNAQTIKEKDAEILALKNSSLPKQENAPILVNVAAQTNLPTTGSSSSVAPVHTQGMFKETGIRRRTTRPASNEPILQTHCNSGLGS